MSTQDRYIPGVPCWLDAVQPDPQAAMAFYGELFGWEFENASPAGSPGTYHVARIRGQDVAAVAAQPEGAKGPAVWNTYVWVEDADATAAKVRAAGGSVLAEPADVGPAGRSAAFADPAGAAFSVWQAGAHRGAAVVNEHGSVNFNDLHTSDLDAVRSFYGSVFGWDVLDLGGGSMWTLPAYGDFLERRQPGMGANMAQMGAPDRFEQVVASLSPLSDDDPRATPHWGVTFGVNDADAIADRAAALGGTVIAPPFDAPWVRMTIITDPQGATFTASAFVPPEQSGADDAAATSGA